MAVFEIPESVMAPTRRYSEWRSPQGLNTEIVPWRLWEKAKQSFWDPADIDFSQDARDWSLLTEGQHIAVAGLARGFMVGEESVTCDIVPLLIALADEGRMEEVMYLTTFAMEEAKHVDFFRRWFDAVGIDLDAMQQLADERSRAAGIEPLPLDRTEGLFERQLPKTMRRVLVDRSPRAVLDASVTYNQFVEGCLAISGYRVWGEMFGAFGVLPGLQEGLRLIRSDEGRHITYGTYLCRRIVAAHPDLLDFARHRIGELRDYYYGSQVPAGGLAHPDGDIPPDAKLEDVWLSRFYGYVDEQVVKRIQILERASHLSEEQAVTDSGAIKEEAELVEAVAI